MDSIYTRDLAALVVVLNRFENCKEDNEKILNPSFGELRHDIRVTRPQVRA